ncbi:transposase [Pseudoscardovia radai]|uniref:Transposase n=1 Tax=Pseudoscardovia radai TaxID=987066 RepID=A0A261EXP2_9BIFI|nr:transposase [Pseudoscardovia radai]
MVYEFDGTEYDKLRDMQEARRAKYLELVHGGMNFTQAARAVGVSKRTGKVSRNGRTRSTGRNERPLADWCRGDMDKPKTTCARHLGLDERITIAGMHRAGSGVRAIARTLGRAPSTVSRELHRNADDIGGGYGPNRAQQKATHRLKRPKDRKIAPGTRLWDEVRADLDTHWIPEQIAGRLRLEHPGDGSMNACHETIYQAIYVQGRGELRIQLKQAMRRGRTARRPRGDGQSRRPRFPEPMVMTGDRPADVADRYHEHQ